MIRAAVASFYVGCFGGRGRGCFDFANFEGSKSVHRERAANTVAHLVVTRFFFGCFVSCEEFVGKCFFVANFGVD